MTWDADGEGKGSPSPSPTSSLSCPPLSWGPLAWATGVHLSWPGGLEQGLALEARDLGQVLGSRTPTPRVTATPPPLLAAVPVLLQIWRPQAAEEA